jgi:hypothetical protein
VPTMHALLQVGAHVVWPGVQAAPALVAAALYGGDYSLLALLALLAAASRQVAAGSVQAAAAGARLATSTAAGAASGAVAAAAGSWELALALAALAARALSAHSAAVYHSAVLLRPTTGGRQALLRTRSMMGGAEAAGAEQQVGGADALQPALAP